MNCSVVVPVYNSRHTIERTLLAILKELAPDDELIVVDDGSIDYSHEIAQKVGVHKIIRTESNSGAAVARNIGAQKASGEILVFVDSDIVIPQGLLKNIKQSFHQNLGDVLFCKLSKGSDDQGFYSSYKNTYMNYILKDSHYDLNFVYGSCCAIRAEKFVPWPEGTKYIDDNVWGYTLSNQGRKIRQMTECEVKHIKHYDLSSLVLNDFRVAREFMRFMISHNRWKTLWQKDKFGHTSKKQKLSVVIAFLAPFVLIASQYLAVTLMFLWFVLNASFFKLVYQTKKNALYLVKAVAWTYVSQIVYSMGIISGAAQSLLLKKRKKGFIVEPGRS